MKAKYRVLLLSAASCLAGVSTLWAHAVLIKSVPDADTVVAGPRVDFELTFNTRINAKLSKLTLVSPDGVNPTLVIMPPAGPEKLDAEGTGFSRGSYVLRWQVLAADGHITRGEVPFRVK